MSKKRKPKGIFGITSPGRGGRGSSARAGEVLAPPQMRGKPGISGGTSSRKNNDGDVFTRQNPYKRPRTKSACFIATACAEARGLPDGCYELSLLRLFREEYVAKLPDGEAVLAEYREKAPKVASAIETLGEEGAGEVWEYLYERGVSRAVELILGGAWDEAFGVYEAMCREMERRFLGTQSPLSLPEQLHRGHQRPGKEIQHTHMSTKTREENREVVLALLKTGDARALLAAALIVVTLTLTAQAGARALEEAGRAVLYVGAPSVSVSSAREAGAISRSYAETVSPETLLALGSSEESASRYVVDRALASVTEQAADPGETITAQAALEAGAVYLAQTGTRPPAEADLSSQGELASAGPLRPELGDGTVAPAEDLPAEDSPTKDLAVASDAAGDGEDLAHAGGLPDTPVAADPRTFRDDPAALYPSDPASGGEEPLELVSSFPTDTAVGEEFPEKDPPAEFETGPISAEEQVPTTLAGGRMEMSSSEHEPTNEPADDGREEPVVVPEESPSEEDAADDPIEPTGDEETPPEAPAATEDEEDGDEFAIFPTPADERLAASAEASTSDSGDGASGESTVGVSLSQEQTAEEGFEDDAREQVVMIVVGDEPDQGQNITVADGEVRDETPRRSPEPTRDGETSQLDTAEPTDITEVPPETTPEGETPLAEDVPDEGAPGESGPQDRQDDRASPERPASGPEANDPRGNPRGGPVASPPGGRRGDPGRVQAGAEDGPEDREPTHGGPEANGCTPRDDADRHPRRPADAPETMSRQPRVLSDGARRPEETPAEDGARRTAREGEAYREDAVEQARSERARQERLAAPRAARERRAARQTPATFEAMRTESENRGHGRRAPLAAEGRGLEGAGDDGAPNALDAPNREEEDLD